MQNSIFIAQESSWYLVLKYINTPYVKRIDFFCVYKNVSQKKVFKYKFKLQWVLSAKDDMYLYIQTKIAQR